MVYSQTQMKGMCRQGVHICWVLFVESLLIYPSTEWCRNQQFTSTTSLALAYLLIQTHTIEIKAVLDRFHYA